MIDPRPGFMRNGLVWKPAAAFEQLGFIPDFLSAHDDAPAAQQFNKNYSHGGGWLPLAKWKLENYMTPSAATIKYPGDPAIRETARTWLPATKETVIFFPGAWVAIVQPSGAFEVARLD